jgi:alkanesulfonate monooxygenase SsuD/methylene tetrahydromethanopterin reductase-like flavin-dependent oxidoreductase (luciferase family)
MLDQLSGGRVELGIGRGAVPLESAFFGITREEMQDRYDEASIILLKAMEGATLTHHGRYFDLQDVPITLAPVQKPHPPPRPSCDKRMKQVWTTCFAKSRSEICR